MAERPLAKRTQFILSSYSNSTRLFNHIHELVLNKNDQSKNQTTRSKSSRSHHDRASILLRASTGWDRFRIHPEDQYDENDAAVLDIKTYGQVDTTWLRHELKRAFPKIHVHRFRQATPRTVLKATKQAQVTHKKYCWICRPKFRSQTRERNKTEVPQI